MTKLKHIFAFAVLCLALLAASSCGVPRLTAFERGVEYMDHSDYPRALESFEQHIRNKGESLAVCFNIGVCYQDQKKYELAVEWYEKALQFDPRDGDTLVNLGLTYMAQGREAAALSKLVAAARVEKNRAYPLVAMAIYHQKVGRLDRARELFEEAVKREEKSGYLWFHYAALQEQLMSFGDAARMYEKSTEYDPTNPAAFEGAGRCYFLQQNWRKAIENFDFAIYLMPTEARLYVQAADTLVKLNRLQRAVQYLWSARGLKTQDDPEIRSRLLALYPKLLEQEKASNAPAEGPAAD